MKLWKLALLAALVLVAVLALASCGKCEHAYDEAITTKPTCIADGVKTLTCALCGESYTEVVPMLGHDYVDTPTRPTCTEGGYMTHTCKVCGDTYTEDLDPAKGHSYVETVTPATCVADGQITNVCSECGDSVVIETIAATGVHSLITSVVALTEEQKALAPKAIGVEAVACSNCDYTAVTENAVYVYMDFETIPTVAGYEGSEQYGKLSDAYKVDGPNGAGLVYIDMQQNVNATRPGEPGKEAGGNAGSGFYLNGDGRMSLGTATAYMADELYLVSSRKSALSQFTISFDIIHGLKPTKDVMTNKNNMFFCLSQPTQYYQLFSMVLVLDPYSLNEDATAHELVVQRYDYKGTPTDPGYSVSTGFFMDLEKEYSIKIEIDYTMGSVATLFIKETGSFEEYQSLGTFKLNPYIGTNDYGHIYFCGSKNSIDNFKVSAPLGAERLSK